MKQIFLLSPASTSGLRTQHVLNPRATFPIACRLRAKSGVGLGELFSFLSGLYFRGKWLYAKTFAAPPPRVAGAWIITSNRGLWEPDRTVRLSDLRSFARQAIDDQEPGYREPLKRDLERLAAEVPADVQIVLLGSISTGKYLNVISSVFAERVYFPKEFIGRGDMSRGGLMLRCVADRTELEYIPVVGALRRGKRPPRLAARPGLSSTFP